jgi:molecular chaperone GrpE
MSQKKIRIEADDRKEAVSLDEINIGDEEQAPARSGELAALVAERDQLRKEKEELQDLLQRRQAEFENFRKRSDKERSEAYEAATMETVRGVLGVLDDFERAIKAAREAGGSDEAWVKGMELIYQRLMDSLTKLGLEPLHAEGEIFDPNLHHAIQKVEPDGDSADVVLEEFQRGYKFKGRLLRPAMVKVAARG